MDFLRRNAKRIVTDAAGYLLILAGLTTGWLPGPGGLPLIIAGLGVLSINNQWAQHIRDWVKENGGRALHILFPRWPWLEWVYDIIALLLLTLAFWLELRHDNLWLIGIGITAFFIAIVIALTNRDRWNRFRHKHKQ